MGRLVEEVGSAGTNAAMLLLVAVGTSILTSCSEPVSSASSAPVSIARSSAPTSTTPTLPPPRLLEIPTGPTPIIDGVLDAGEWDDAATVEMSDGTPILWMYAVETLYVAVNSEVTGSVNLALLNDDQLWILHSSAALGSARYEKAPSTWELIHGFDWCCRSTTDLSQRDALLNSEGWQANIGFTENAGTVEYEVRMPWSAADVAVSFVVDADTASFWPVDLGSDARAQLVGPRDSDVEFETSDWFRLRPLQP